MGDAQSAQRDDEKDAEAEEESGTVEDAPTIQHNIQDKSLKNKGQLSEINGKADSSVTELNGLCEEEFAAEAILSPDEDVSETEKPLKEEETPLENVEINEKESPNEADANEDVPLETKEMDAKQNDINESFRRFFSNIGFKLTVKRGSGDIATDVPDETSKEEPNGPEDAEDTAKEITSMNAEQNTALETYDNDSTTCPTLTDGTSEDVLENAEEKTTETKEEVESDNADASTISPVEEDAQQDATTEEQPHSTSPSSPEEEEVVSPIKRFFTTGIFSGLRKKKKPAEDETPDKELEDMGEKEALETTQQTVQDQQQDKEDISLGVEAAAVETEHREIVLKEEILTAATIIDASTIIVTEPGIQEIQILSSQEKDKVQASPLKRLLSGSSLKKLSKKQRSRKSSDAKPSDSGEHVADQFLSSTESAENLKEEGCAQPSAEAAGEEDGAWASFKKLMTPKKRIKRSSLSNEGTQIPGSVEEPKPSEGGQISDHSTEEGKKRKDSSVSWDSVLCGSGRKRSRKTSDSEDEPPKIDNHINKQDVGSKHGAESAQESSNEVDEILAYFPKQAGSPSESDGGSTWKSLKRLVTPKRKAKDEDESRDNVQSDSDATPDESSFSIKKLLPGRKKRKSAEKQDQVSSDEADKDAASGDEDSDTPAVVPLSEFDTVETEVHIQTQADVESHIPKEADSKLQQDLLDQMAEPVLPCDSLQTEAKKDQENDDALENKASTTPDKKEEHDDSDTESLSKPQLSDIPEEATPASATEEAARDDTIAEDLVEITSEAFTAPEPLDNTLADETEMISAVSQLSSESSKTSGNTTPVPADYVVMETDELLHQVVENISISPKAVPVCSDELRSERIVVSRSHQILETFVKEEATILEIHKGLDATDINTVLNVEEQDAINELAATTQTESTSEVNDSVSTEIVSEVATEEFDTAEIAVDEVHDVDVTHPEESLNELESIDDYPVESLSEVNAAVSTDLLPKGDEIVPDEGSLVEAHQNETDPPKMDSQEADSAATVADETKDGSMEQEVKSLTEKEDQMMHNITDQIQAEDKDQPLVEVEKLQELAAVQAAALDSEEGRVQSLGKDIIPEDITAVETVAYKLKEEIVPLAEVNVEPEKEDELDAAKPEHVQGPEASEAVQASTFDSVEGSVQSPNEEVKSEDILPVEPVDDESKQTAERLTEISVKPENKELPANAIKTVQEPEVLESVQAPTSDSLEGNVQSPKEEEKSEDTPPAETVTDEPKEETITLTGANFEPVDISKEPEVLETVQAPTLYSEEGSVQSLEKEVISEDVPEAQTVTDEPNDETMHPIEVNLEPVDASKTEHVQEPEALQAVQGPEVLQAVQASTSDSSESSVQLLEKEAISEDVPEAETVTDEPKKTAEHFTEVSIEPENKELPANVIKTVQEPEVLESVQAPTSDSSDGSVQSLEKEVISEDAPDAKTVTDEPKDETMPPIEVNLEPVDASKTEHVQEPEVLQAVQGPEVLQAVKASTLDSEEGSVQSLEKEAISEDVPEAETVTDEPKKTAEHFTEVSIEPENKELPANVIKTVQEPEVLESVQAPTSDSSDGSVQSLEKEVISEDAPDAKNVTDEPKDETMPPIEVNLEPVDASKTEHVQEPEVLQAVKASTLDSEEGSVQSLEKEAISEDVPEAETVTDEPKKTAEHLAEVSVEPENKELPTNAIKTVQEPEVLESVQAPTLDSEEGSVQLLEKEVISEDVPEAKTVTDEPKDETMPPVVVNIEPLDASKTEHVQEPEILQAVQGPEVLQAVQASTSDSSEGGVQSLEKEAISENVPEAETVTDVPKEETIPLNEAKLEPVDASKTECVQEPQVLQSVQAPTLDSVEGSVQSLEKEVISEHVPEAETVTDEPKEETTPLTGANLEPVDASQTEHVQEPENKELPANAVKTVQEPEVLESVQAPTLDSEEGSVQLLEKEVISEDVPEAKTVTDEPKDETMPPVVVNIEPVDASKTEHVQEPEILQAVQGPEILQAVQGPEVLQAVQASTSDSSEGGVQSLEKEAISENVPEAETVTDVPKEETIPLNEAKLEPVDASKTECVQEPQVLQSVQAPTLDSVEGSVQSLEKEVISEHVPEAETVTDEPKEETTPLTGANLEPVDASQTEHVQEPENKELPANAVKTVQEPKILESIQAPTSDSAEGSVQSPKEEVKSEDIQPAEIVTDEPKEETIPLTGANLEPVDTSKEPEVLETVQAPTLESEEGSVQSLEKEVISEDVPEAQTIADEPKEETTPPIKVNFEPEEATKTEHVKEPEVLEAVQAATVDSEVGSLQSLEKEVISEDIPAVEKVTDEPKQETEVDPEEKLPVEAANVGHVQEPEVLEAVQADTVDSEVGSLQSLEKEVISEDITAMEKVTDEPKQETDVDPEEKLPVEATKTEHQEPEALPSDVKDIVMETKTDEETSMFVNVVTESIEGGSAQELVKQILSEDVPKPDVDNVVTSVTDGLESEVVAQLDPSLEIAEDQKTESIPQDVRVEQEDRIPEVVEELQILTAVCVSSVNEEASNVQVQEKTVFTGETQAPCVDNAAVTKGPEREVHLSAVQVSVEAQKESELPGTEVKTAAVEHTVVTQVVICNVKDLSAAVPDVLIKKTSPSTEPLIDRVASELVVIVEVETTTPLVKDDVSETAKEGSVIMMMHVPSVEFEENHRIQVQVVTDDIKSAETIVDTLLEVGVTEAKEVIDVCNETVKKVANLSATPEIEEELINEENKVSVQEVIQNVKENLPETVSESVVVNLEQEGIKQPDAMTEVSEMVESESKVVEDQKTMEESIATLRERQDEAPTVISEVSSTQQRVSEDLMQTPDRPGSLDVSIQDQKDDLEETERDKPEAGIAVGEVKSNQIIHEGARIIQSPIVPPSNTELVAPQNTGIISSTGNVESLSSLSIPQFGQANALASPPPTTEIFEPVKKTDVSEVEVQAVEVVEPIKPTKQIELTEIAVQATETTEPAQNFNSTERAVIMAQPVLLDINIQAMETVEPVEQINSTERVTSSVQATETIQPVRQTEKREVILSPPVLSEDCDQETKAEEPVKRKEEDKDVWMDAEENIYTQEKTEMSLLEVEESVKPQTESEQKEKAGQEVEMAPKSKNEEEESQQEMYKTARTREIDSDGEDFAVALEHPEMETASVMTMECN